MRIELAHDIIALKIWEQLPERDKKLRRIKSSLQQRVADHKKGAGSLLGEKELIAWEDSLEQLDLQEEEKDFIQASQVNIKKLQQEKEEQEQRELNLAKEKIAAEEKIIQEQQEKLAAQQKARKRQNIFSALLGIAFLAAMGAGYFANQQRIKADKNREEAEELAMNINEAMQELSKKTGEEILSGIKEDSSKHDIKGMVEKAKSLQLRLKESEEKIQKATASDSSIVADFNNAVADLRIKSQYYIENYEQIVLQDKADKYKEIRQAIDKHVSKDQFDTALGRISEISELKIPNSESQLNNLRNAIKLNAADYYINKARSQFNNSSSPRGKIIDPYKWLGRAEDKYLGKTTEAISILRQKICNDQVARENSDHRDIQKILDKCQ